MARQFRYYFRPPVNQIDFNNEADYNEARRMRGAQRLNFVVSVHNDFLTDTESELGWTRNDILFKVRSLGVNLQEAILEIQEKTNELEEKMTELDEEMEELAEATDDQINELEKTMETLQETIDDHEAENTIQLNSISEAIRVFIAIINSTESDQKIWMGYE